MLRSEEDARHSANEFIDFVIADDAPVEERELVRKILEWWYRFPPESRMQIFAQWSAETDTSKPYHEGRKFFADVFDCLPEEVQAQ